MTHTKYKLLGRGLLYDAIGMVTMGIPVIGPFLDLIWAPFAAREMQKMYKGEKGKIASILVFIEEILPVSDIIPTFTLMWLYTFVWNRKEQPVPQTIEVEVND
ncbi:MAG: hypothetical protein CMC35_01895 [Flavobacteriaceae bacterium]|nr:hypothetical protein [Flavobacteriaceae bacterium]|tara:strand:- start:14117 stop:14425 length:309 start_codon:yes stop_codon:yes gene_type:complete